MIILTNSNRASKWWIIIILVQYLIVTEDKMQLWILPISTLPLPTSRMSLMRLKYINENRKPPPFPWLCKPVEDKPGRRACPDQTVRWVSRNSHLNSSCQTCWRSKPPVRTLRVACTTSPKSTRSKPTKRERESERGMEIKREGEHCFSSLLAGAPWMKEVLREAWPRARAKQRLVGQSHEMPVEGGNFLITLNQ